MFSQKFVLKKCFFGLNFEPPSDILFYSWLVYRLCLAWYNAGYLRLVNDRSVINIKINMTLIVGVR